MVSLRVLVRVLRARARRGDPAAPLATQAPDSARAAQHEKTNQENKAELVARLLAFDKRFALGSKQVGAHAG